MTIFILASASQCYFFDFRFLAAFFFFAAFFGFLTLGARLRNQSRSLAYGS